MQSRVTTLAIRPAARRRSHRRRFWLPIIVLLTALLTVGPGLGAVARLAQPSPNDYLPVTSPGHVIAHGIAPVPNGDAA